MSDIRPSFPTTENTGTGAGVSLGSRVEGDASAAIAGAISFAFKDNSGNVILPALSATGQIVTNGLTDAQLRATAVPVSGPLTDAQLRATPVPVTFGTVTGNGKRARGTVGGSLTLVTVATLALAVSQTYENLDFVISCFRDSRFQVILNDNGAESIIVEGCLTPGCSSFHGQLSEAEFVTGATGTQSIIIKALNLNSLSDFYASVSVKLA